MTQIKEGNLPKEHLPNTLNAKLDKSDPLRYRQTLEIITTPIKYWIILSLASAVGILIWSFLARIPQKTVSNGVFANPFEIFTLNEQEGIVGKYLNIYVKNGDKVVKDQTLAELEIPSLKENIKSAREAYEENQKLLDLEYSTNSYNSIINNQKNLVKSNLKYLEESKVYFNKGAIPESIVRAAEQTYQTSLQNLFSSQKQYIQAKGNLINLKYKLDQAISDYSQKSIIKSPITGSIQKIFKTVGQITNSGGSFMQISRENKFQKLSLLSFFDSKSAANIKKGQPVHILPYNVKPNSVGQLFGVVRNVSPLPFSEKDASSILGSEIIAKELIRENRSILVTIDLIENSKSPTGYKWINGPGPKSKNTNQFPKVGILATTSVITESIPPITVGLPAIKKFFGIN